MTTTYSHPKRPRQYADEILRLATLEERRAALAAVPEEDRDLTRRHVENAWARRQRRIQEQQP